MLWRSENDDDDEKRPEMRAKTSSIIVISKLAPTVAQRERFLRQSVFVVPLADAFIMPHKNPTPHQQGASPRYYALYSDNAT